jgi:chromosome segregation ATPase
MIGMTPGAASNAIDSLRLLELAADPKKLRQALESMQGEQAKIQEQIEMLRIHTSASQKAAQNAHLLAEHAAEMQKNAEEKLAGANSMLDAAASAELAVKGMREQLNRDIAMFEQTKSAARNEIANVRAEAEAIKQAAADTAKRAEQREAKAAAAEASAKAMINDYEARIQKLRDIVAPPLKG